MAIPLPLETRRLLIRAFEPEDATDMVEVYCDPEVMRYVAGGALADEAAVRVMLHEYAKPQTTRGFSSWALAERDSERVIGDVGFGVFEDDIELGYTLARSLWGRGYATEAARACLEAGLEHLDVERIVSVVDAENKRSLRVPERICMQRLGEIEAYGRPHVLFAATRR